MSQLKVWLLGAPRVEQGGAEVTFETRKALALLAYLALHEPAQRREGLASLLWPEYEQARAYANLRRTLYALKQGIGERWLAIDAESVALVHYEDWWLDVAAFDAALVAASTHQHEQPALCATCVAALAEAVALYRDDLLAGFTLPDSAPFDEWHFFQSERLRQAAVGALARLVAAHRARGELEKALAQARRWLAFDPLHEPAHRALMCLYAETGQRAAALRQYEQCVQLLVEEFALPPVAETTRLYEAIQANQLAPARAAAAVAQPVILMTPPVGRLNNLPIPRTPFLGREQERAAVMGLLREPGCHLLTLTGPGGTGKTRLAIQVAMELVAEFPAGVCWVELALLRDPALVPSTMLQALSVREAAGKEPREQLQEALRARPGLLLLLDNFEHLLAAAPLLSDLLSAVSDLTLLVTSRAPLHLYGEQEYAVPPLRLPDAWPADEVDLRSSLARNEAVTLFVQRAAAVRADFQLTRDNALAVAELCRHLDGLPLAIELAAARIKLFSPEALLARLAGQPGQPLRGTSLQFLKGGAQDRPTRQQTLHNIIAWSYELLPEEERTLFMRLAVFVGGCTIAAAQVVCAIGDDRAMDVLDGVSALLDKSLVQRLGEVEGEPRVGMLETVRAYAAEWLEDSGEAVRVRNRHLAFFLQLAEEAVPALVGPRQGEWNSRLAAEMDNLRAALEWALADSARAEEALRLSSALLWFYRSVGIWNEGRLWLQKALEQGRNVTTTARAEACLAASRIALFQGAYEQAQRLSEEGLASSRTLQEVRGVAGALELLGVVAAVQGKHQQATRLYEEGLTLMQQKWSEQPEKADRRFLTELLLYSAMQAALRGGEYERGAQLATDALALAREGQDIQMIAASCWILGMFAYFQGHTEQAEAWFQEGLALARQAGHKWFVAANVLFRGRIAYEQERFADAAVCLRESTLLYWQIGDKERLTHCLIAWAGFAATQQQHERAARLLGAAQRVLDETGLVLEDGHRLDLERLVALVRRQLDAATWAATWAAGQTVTLEEVIDYVLAG